MHRSPLVQCALVALAVAQPLQGARAQDFIWFREPLHRWAILAQIGRVDQAVSVLSESLAVDSGNVEYLADLATLYHQRGELINAIATWRAVLARDSAMLRAYSGLGNAYADAGKLDSAIAVHRRLTARDSMVFEGHLDLGSALEQAGRYGEALDAFQRARNLRPYAAIVLYDLAVTYARLGRNGDALDAAVAAARVDEWYPNLLTLLRALAQEALPTLEAEARSNRTDPVALLRIAYAHSYRQDWRKAHRRIDQALRLAPDNPQLLGMKAWFHSREQDHDAAIKVARRCEGADWFCKAVLGWSYLRTDPAAARRVLSEAVQERPDVVALQMTYATALMQLDDYQGAITPNEAALRLHSSHHDVAFNLADCYMKTGQLAAAWRYARVAERAGASTWLMIERLTDRGPEPSW